MSINKIADDTHILKIDPSVLDYITYKNEKLYNSYIDNFDLNNIDTIILDDIKFYDRIFENNNRNKKFLEYLINKIKDYQIKYLQISGLICYIEDDNLYRYIHQPIKAFIQKIYDNTNIKNISLIDLKKKRTYCTYYGAYDNTDTYTTEISNLTIEDITSLTEFLTKKLTKYIYYKHIQNERLNKEKPPLLNLQIYDNKFKI